MTGLKIYEAKLAFAERPRAMSFSFSTNNDISGLLQEVFYLKGLKNYHSSELKCLHFSPINVVKQTIHFIMLIFGKVRFSGHYIKIFRVT